MRGFYFLHLGVNFRAMENEQYPAGQPEKFSDDPQEQLRIENEILRIKVRTELGGIVEMGENLPPELENEFLKNVLAFEHRYANVKMVRIGDLLGRPGLPAVDTLDDSAMEKAFTELESLLEEYDIVVEFTRPREARFKYRFIVEELFEHETDDMVMEGMTRYFNYEEFHPDHPADLKEYTIQFLGDWFQRKTDAARWHLDDEFIYPDGRKYSRDEMIAQFKRVFAAYVSFDDCGYTFDDFHFDLSERDGDANQGMGFTEGMVKYTATLESGEKKQIEGPYKFYFCRSFGRWQIFYFHLAGFND